MRRIFTSHPRSVGESYLEHLVAAAGFSARLLIASAACLIHAFLPFLCERTGSRAIARLHDEMIAKRAAGSGRGAGRQHARG